MLTTLEVDCLSEADLLKYDDEICPIYWINEKQVILYTLNGPRTVQIDHPLLSVLTDAERVAHKLTGEKAPYRFPW